MDNVITVMFKPFDLYQQVDVWQNNESVQTYKATLDEIEDSISDLCYSKNIFNVRLLGHDAYLNELRDIIYAKEANTYHSNKINVEVN